MQNGTNNGGVNLTCDHVIFQCRPMPMYNRAYNFYLYIEAMLGFTVNKIPLVLSQRCTDWNVGAVDGSYYSWKTYIIVSLISWQSQFSIFI